MNYTKQPIDIPAQIAMLQERGMHIPDVEIARKCLGSISYFRLASYWRPMEEEHVSHRFKPGSSFMTAMKDARMDEEEIARKWRDEHRLLVDSWIPKSENK